MIIIISASARIGGAKNLTPSLWWRLGAMRAGARERRLRASERPAGGVGGARGELVAKTRPPGRVPGAAVRLLGVRASAPVGNGGCPPPGADGRPGCARSGGENPKFPPRRWLRSVPRGQPMAIRPYCIMALWHYGIMATWQHGNMATWQHGIVVSWHRGIG